MLQLPDEINDLYRDVILDHYRDPRNSCYVENPDIKCHGFNPFCGDEVDLQVRLDAAGVVVETGFQGNGCSISQASASMLTEVVKGKDISEIETLRQLFRSMMQGDELQEEHMDDLGDLQALEGVRRFPVRIKCALLAWSALYDGLEEYRGQQS